MEAAIDVAQLVLDNSSSKTEQQLTDAKDTLNQAIIAFGNSKVEAVTGLVDVIVTNIASDSSNHITLENGETLAFLSNDESVANATEQPSGTIQVTCVTAGDPVTITVHVKKDGQVIKTGTFKVTTVVPMSTTSKALTNFDFSTISASNNGSQFQLKSKAITVGDFTGNRKDFTIVIGEERIPIYISWKLSVNYPKGMSMGSVVESAIQQYYSPNIMTRPIQAFGTGDNFQVTATQAFTVEGTNWSYFFEHSFTVSDGIHTATIQLTSNFLTMDTLIVYLNQCLTKASVKAKFEKVNEMQFKVISTANTGKLIINGVNNIPFFE